MQIWIFQLAFVISIEWRILANNSSDEEEDAEDHYDSDNGLTPEEREYRRQRDEQDASHNADRTPARRAEIRENNRRRHQERRAARAADDILPIYERHDNNIPDYNDETASRRSTSIPLTGNETWGDLNDTATITRLTIQQRADALALALVDSYRQHRSLPRTQSWDQWQELREHWYHINGYAYTDIVPRHLLTPMYTAAPNAQLLTETVPAEYVCETRTQTLGEESDPDFWINKGLMERPDPCQLLGIKYSLMECNRCQPIMFQEHHLFSTGPRTEIRPRSLDLYSMTAGDIIRMLEISDHQTDEVHINRHTRLDSCQFWSFEENPRCYLIILDSIYTVPLDVFSSFLSTFVFPELPGLTPPRRSSN
jgi:hypothetical protein